MDTSALFPWGPDLYCIHREDLLHMSLSHSFSLCKGSDSLAVPVSCTDTNAGVSLAPRGFRCWTLCLSAAQNRSEAVV
ncbi:hypothetical protein XELAEV_18041528mg [Xenopus laevis]|uniref:Uncharacterized protein n=1 Tax=Xenopus laevis TaxID=8355 RepID=A0A974C2E3_XENLA|nr:hypothetical protein XELAEV_18041528mg [Xenopus laevis]